MVELRFRIRSTVFNFQEFSSRRSTIRPLALCLPSVEEAALLGEVDEVGRVIPRRGVFFTGKGAKLESGNISGNNWYRATTRPYYIEIPVNAVIKLPLGDQSSFFFGAGPYLGIGVGGKNRLEGQASGISYSRSENIKFSNDDPFTSNEEGSGYNVMRRFDYGLNGTVGIQAKYAVFSVNYGWGLAKLQSGTTSSNDELNKYRVLSFTAGFKL